MGYYQTLASTLDAERNMEIWEHSRRYLDNAREALAQAAQAGQVWVRFATAKALEALEEGEEVDLNEVWLDLLLAGPDDEWSGRSGDVRRAFYGGMLSEVSRLRDLITRGW